MVFVAIIELQFRYVPRYEQYRNGMPKTKKKNTVIRYNLVRCFNLSNSIDAYILNRPADIDLNRVGRFSFIVNKCGFGR